MLTQYPNSLLVYSPVSTNPGYKEGIETMKELKAVKLETIK